MLILKVLAVALFGSSAVIFGSMATAWRRACVKIAQSVACMHMLQRPTQTDLAMVTKLSQEDIIRFTPSWVSARHLMALMLLLCTTALTFLLFQWYVGFAVALGAYILIELTANTFPKQDSVYYVKRVYNSFLQAYRLAEQNKDEARATDFRERLNELREAYGNHLDDTGI